MTWRTSPPGSGPRDADEALAASGRIRTDTRVGEDGTRSRSHAICIASGKGGTGKSILTSNLGVFLASTGRSVLLVDADFGLANLHILLGVHPRFTLADVVEGRVPLGDAIETSPFGPSLLSGASGLPRLAQTSEADLRTLAEALEEIGERFDVLLLDGAAGLSPLSVALALACHELLLVTNRDLTALTDAYAVLKTVHGQDAGLAVGVLVNRVDDEIEGRGIFDRFVEVSRRFLQKDLEFRGWIPEDAAVARAVQARRPLLDLEAASPAAAAIRRAGLSLLDGIRRDHDGAPSGPHEFHRRLGEWLRRGPSHTATSS